MLSCNISCLQLISLSQITALKGPLPKICENQHRPRKSHCGRTLLFVHVAMEHTQRDHYPKHEFYSWVPPGFMASTRCWKHSSEILVRVNATASSGCCKPSAPPHPTALVLYQDLVADGGSENLRVAHQNGPSCGNSDSAPVCGWVLHSTWLFFIKKTICIQHIYLKFQKNTKSVCPLSPQLAVLGWQELAFFSVLLLLSAAYLSYWRLPVNLKRWPFSTDLSHLRANITSLGVCWLFHIFLCELERENLKNTEILQR